jgi:hypothetical protein
MKKEVILYPPTGGEGVIPHPSKIEEMKAKGWSEKSKPVIKSKSKEQYNAKS